MASSETLPLSCLMSLIYEMKSMKRTVHPRAPLDIKQDIYNVLFPPHSVSFSSSCFSFFFQLSQHFPHLQSPAWIGPPAACPSLPGRTAVPLPTHSRILSAQMGGPVWGPGHGPSPPSPAFSPLHSSCHPASLPGCRSIGGFSSSVLFTGLCV